MAQITQIKFPKRSLGNRIKIKKWAKILIWIYLVGIFIYYWLQPLHVEQWKLQIANSDRYTVYTCIIDRHRVNSQASIWHTSFESNGGEVYYLAEQERWQAENVLQSIKKQPPKPRDVPFPIGGFGSGVNQGD